jgi:peptidoglycan/xylan/chitin deacetylase (PgdA/CDA1 family)
MNPGRTGVCVLTLHRVVASPSKDHDVSWPAFMRLIDLLGEVPVPISSVLDGSSSARVALTFDDGTEDHAEVGEVLAERELSAVFFVPANAVGRPGHLDEAAVRRLAELGHVIGSHSFEHRPLAGLSFDALRSQVRRSKEELRASAGTPIHYFAPPGGIGHELLPTVLAESGFRASRSMRWGFFRRPEERWQIPCLPVTELTLRRGWIAAALADWDLPLTMRGAWRAKRAMPRRAAIAARHLLHAAGGRSG